ncbi:endonuclease VII domain-containing protein (plasmid) [Skermanella rosea]|uniref:endonuclease VII domain-containing protein n=1 Tax=Skermanella rosea TaxID=1817965 RepID=UPI0019340785|nr:endonuclease VII domain-containing protein [Skermanella rosea]UEM08001.1 endonuclease VII domain-containing protein [Skermanella rosea]
MSRHALPSKKPGLSSKRKSQPINKRSWTEEEDEFLIFYGPVVGYDNISLNDFGRAKRTGIGRISWLRKYKPELVEKIEKESGKPSFDPSLSTWQRWKARSIWKLTVTGYEAKSQAFRAKNCNTADQTDNMLRCGAKQHQGNRFLPLSDFPTDARRTNGKSTHCRDCTNQSIREWNRNNKTKRLDIKHRNRYGISLEQREKLFLSQNEKCAICGIGLAQVRSLDICLDHCHKTSVVRGILCRGCNTMLGRACDSPAILRQAADYLLKTPTCKS